MFSCRPLNAKIHLALSMLSGYQKYGKMTKILYKKCSVARFYFSPTWPIYNQWLQSLAQQGSSHPVDHRQHSLLTTSHNPIFMMRSKDLWKWPNINKWGFTLYWMSLDVIWVRCSSLSDKMTNWPKTTRKTEIWKYLFHMTENLYVDTSCMNNHALFMVQTWVGKTDLKILNFPCRSL